ncbi:heavy metal translocating P-type ATPase [Pseudalkalibacillus decolorationis]|uniref:heavy metal translocating P-type ATPase n=1 Tax=Pseudalkalibacillus decolorationis TaxID=163879 RepID=UPI002148C291|nr:heavy metal translocating P-type ATPase [Pseudalkalibacillus decolorationis]
MQKKEPSLKQHEEPPSSHTEHEEHHNHEDHNGSTGHHHKNHHHVAPEDHGHEGHGGHDHHGHDHEHMIDDFKKRFYISLVLTIPILLLSPMIQMFLGFELTFPGSMYVLFALATIVFFYGGWPFLTGLADELRQKSPGMMTLIGLAIIVAYGYSSLVIFGFQGKNFFWELATLIDIMLLGHWIEMRSVMNASNSLEELVKLMPKEAHLISENGDVMEVPVSELNEGDHVLIKPGEKVPADGTVIKGNSSIDESMLTGESIPVDKQKEDELIGGSINGEGSLTISIKKTGEEGYLSQVVNLVKEAQETKSKTQALSDRAAKWLFYVALSAGAITLVIWLSIGYPFDSALERTVTVLVISCPHALGLAVPLVVAKSTALSAQNGLLIRNRTSFEEARKLEAIVFDKTGTLTKGEFGVTDIITQNNKSETDVLQLAASLEAQSEHPIARGIVQTANEREIRLIEPDDFESITGKGLQGRVDGKELKIVSPGYATEYNIQYDENQYDKLASDGKTVIFVIADDQLHGMIALADQIKETSVNAIKKLKEMGIQPMMLTGDNRQVASWVGRQLDIDEDEIFAEVLPHEKADKIKEIKRQGTRVAMTGDGINDAPALANADLGIAVGAGTDVAMETADVVLAKSNSEDVVAIINLSQATYRKMIQNLWWAAGYNIIALPLAAGVLYPIGILLDPAVGAVLMSLSTIVVAFNARILKV